MAGLVLWRWAVVLVLVTSLLLLLLPSPTGADAPTTTAPDRPDCPHACTCDHQLRRVNCANTSRTTMPSNLPSSIQYLNLHGNWITRINNRTLANLTNLIQLDLSDNLLESIIPSAFNNLQDLQTLYLHNNFIWDIETGTFSGLSSLTELNLHGNLLSQVPADLFSNDSILSAVDLSGNNISSISEDFLADLQLLRFLNLSGNSLQNFSVAWPENCTTWSHDLEVLDISHNRLGSLGKANGLQGFKLLRQLFLDTNDLAWLDPTWMKDLVNLTHLSISENPLVTLPADLLQASTQLEWFNVSHMSNLRHVDSASLTGLVGLTVIDMSHNGRLAHLHPTTFSSLSSVTFIDLSYNCLSNINSATFHNLSQLQHVRLEGNPWLCNCDLHWMGLTNHTSNHSVPSTSIISPEDLVCAMPLPLQGLRLIDILPFYNFSCQGPRIVNHTNHAYFEIGSSARLDCVTEGDPTPYIKWITPKKEVLPHHPAYVNPGRPGPWHTIYHLNHPWHDSKEYAENMNYDGRIHVLHNGSLYFDYVLRQDSGPYTCIVQNDIGNDTVVIHFRLNYLIITETMVKSMLVGFISAMSFFIVGLTVGLIRYLSFKCSHEQRQKRKSIRQVLEGLETFRTDKLDKFSAYKTAKIDQLSAFKCAKVDKLRGYKNLTVTTLVHYLHRSREHYSGQMLRIKDNCTMQVEKLRESYSFQKLKFHDYRSHHAEKIRDNYNGQLIRIRQYGSSQVERLREQYKLQQQHILKLLELMDIGNCMSVIEAECLRTESMIFNSDLTFDLDTTVHVPYSVSQSGSEYMTAGDNSDNSSVNSKKSGSINFTVKLENEITATSHEQPPSDIGGVKSPDSLEKTKSGRPPSDKSRTAVTNPGPTSGQASSVSQKDNNGQVGKPKHSHRKHHAKHQANGPQDDEEEINRKEHRMMRDRDHQDRKERREKRPRQNSKDKESTNGKSQSRSVNDQKRRTGRGSKPSGLSHKRAEMPLDITNLRREPFTLSLPDLNLDFSLDGCDLNLPKVKVKSSKKPRPIPQESLKKQTVVQMSVNPQSKPETTSKSQPTVHPHIGDSQRQVSTEAGSTDYESAQEPDSTTATPRVSIIEEQTGTPQSFASFPSTPSTPTLTTASASHYSLSGKTTKGQHSPDQESINRESTV